MGKSQKVEERESLQTADGQQATDVRLLYYGVWFASLQTILGYFLSLKTKTAQLANGVTRDVIHRFYQGAPYLQIVIRFHGTLQI